MVSFGIAWSVASRLAKSMACRCLFATHFHELTRLESEATPSTPIINRHFTAQTSKGKLTLLYQIRPGKTTSMGHFSTGIWGIRWVDATTLVELFLFLGLQPLR